MKFPKAHGVGEIREDQVLARKCYQAALASRENHTWVINEPEPIPESSETPQEVEVVPGDSSKVLKIGSTFPTLEKEKMISLLRANQDVFAWKHKDMPGIDKKIIQHRLNVNLKYKPVQQKWRIFALERNKAVTEKVEKLLEAVRDRAPGPFYDVLGQTHVNGWSRVIASQNGGSTDYIFPL